MKTTIEFDPSFTILTAELSPGESIKAEPGAMAAQQGLDMRTGMGGGGGLFGGFKRMLGGESFFLNTFTAGHGGGWISLAPPTPGDIISHELWPGQDLFIQGSSFLACTENVHTDAKFQGMRGMFSGEKIFFLRAYTEGGQGAVHVNSYGPSRSSPSSRAASSSWTPGMSSPSRTTCSTRSARSADSDRSSPAARGWC